jgi:catechol 2,3-dioxygenase-like lactoylglutathione lyase family enzyme
VTSTIPARLNVVTLGARDFSRLRDFYRGFGWEMVVDLDNFAAFQMQGAVLTLFPLDELAADAHATAAAPEHGMRGFSMAIVVHEPSEVDAAIAAARAAGARIAKEPVEAKEFEGRSSYFADPENNFWEVVCVDSDSRMAQAVRRATGNQPGGPRPPSP